MSTDIFLSYASQDSAKAGELARLLEACGWSVWWDRSGDTGADSESARALSDAKVVAVLWSTFSVASNRVKNEAAEAKESNRLIPVLLEDARIPLSFRALSSIDLRQWPDIPAPLEIAKLKTLARQAMNAGDASQPLKKPATNDGMTLSVRVAKHMAARRNGRDAESAAPDFSLAIERCVNDIFLDMLTTLPQAVESNIDTYITQLAKSLEAATVIFNRVDFSRMSVSDIRSINPGKVTATEEKAILGYVNQYCSPDGEHNLRVEPGKWPEGTMLCLPLPAFSGGRAFAWFMARTVHGQWTAATQDQLLRLAAGIQAGVRVAS